jgi:glucan phosphoethanolaminetransferase (alkaline phosphatase superfamily)
MQFLLKALQNSFENLGITLIAATYLVMAWHFLLRRKKFFHAALMLGFALIAISIYGGGLAWLSGLGGDSFLEATHFDVSEAFFWISTFLSSMTQMLAPPKIMVLMAVEALFISIIIYLIVCWRPKLFGGVVLLLVVGHLNLFHIGYAGFEAGRSYIKTLQGMFDRHPAGFSSLEDIDLFVYIGESTSTLNMSLYGYPLPTTPQLARLSRQDTGFLRFEKVRSTHTHTSLSLLRALAITSSQTDGKLTRWGIGNVLKSAGLTPQLLSVQPLSGSFANFSKFVFDGIDMKIQEEDRYKGNLAPQRIKDHQLLETALTKSGVVFFHSYAGHGAYLNLIESSMSQATTLPFISFNGVFGFAFSEFLNREIATDVSDYDRAISYIDRNVAHAVENIKTRSKPAVLIYFSDHGDAVYARRGHESSNFIDEMSTVPFVLYFNDAYRVKFPQIFDRYQRMAQDRHTKLLDQVGTTILDLLRIRSERSLDVPTLASAGQHPRPYIIQRDTLSGDSRINIIFDDANGFDQAKFFGGTPEPTYISIINERFGHENSICYHRADSFSKALRAASVTDCFEFDLMVDGDKLLVYHPPASATGFSIENIFSIAQARKNKLWIDSKNLDDARACHRLLSFLEVAHDRVGQILVEFPWNASLKLPELESCGRGLRSIGARTSYYIPTHWLIPCAEDSVKHADACAQVETHVQKAMASGIFSDLSFDFTGYQAVKKMKYAAHFKWNTFVIRSQDFHKFPRDDFDFVIMDTSTDPNTY